jgi:transcriptional antiterminator RfaH
MAASDSHQWWVLHTRPRAEKTLARRFCDRSISFFLPLYQKEWRSRGRRLQSYLPLFPGYVFLHGDYQQRVTALETNLVALVLPVKDQLQLHDDLQRVFRLITTGAPITPEERLEPGDPVLIVKGPLAGLDGKVIRRGKHLKLIIEVQMLRRAVSVEVESWMLQSCTERICDLSPCA